METTSSAMLKFPLSFRFKILAFTRQIGATDAHGQEVCFVKQKAFRWKESVAVFRDHAQTEQIATISADRIIDWSARYVFRDPQGNPFGAVGRRGARSLWRTHYDIFSDSESKNVSMTIQEESVMVRFLDGLFSSIPILGIFSGYFFHPTYAVARQDGTVVARLRKQAAFLEGRFTLEQVGPLAAEEQFEIMLSCLMMALLERERG
jgi:hypothetical protein